MILLANIELYYDWIAKSAAAKAHQNDVTAYFDDDDTSYQKVSGNAIIGVTGPLTYRSDFWTYFFGGCSYQGLMKSILAAEADPDVKQLLFVFDTPGGEVTGIQELTDLMAKCKKPKTAMVDCMCASAGLWIASQCDKIVSVKSGETGSLGVMTTVVSYAKAMEDAGIDVKVIRSAVSPNKNVPNRYEEMTEAATSMLQAKVDKYGDMFLATVAKGRKVTEDYAKKNFGMGAMLDAEEALAAGLIDEIGTIDSLLSGVAATKYKATATRVNLG